MTSSSARVAVSVSPKLMNACPRIRRFECATTDNTGPYVENSASSDCFRTGTFMRSFRFCTYNVEFGAGAGAFATSVASAMVVLKSLHKRRFTQRGAILYVATTACPCAAFSSLPREVASPRCACQMSGPCGCIACDACSKASSWPSRELRRPQKPQVP